MLFKLLGCDTMQCSTPVFVAPDAEPWFANCEGSHTLPRPTSLAGNAPAQWLLDLPASNTMQQHTAAPSDMHLSMQWQPPHPRLPP